MIAADLGSQLEAFVSRLVEIGRYGSKSEVLREGVRLIQDRETQLAALDPTRRHALMGSDAISEEATNRLSASRDPNTTL